MIRAGRSSDRHSAAGPFAVRTAIAALVLAAVLLPVATAQAANPAAGTKPHGHKATPSPAPVVTPAPTPTPTRRPVVTPAPTIRPAVTPAPKPVPTFAPRPVPGRTAAPGSGAVASTAPRTAAPSPDASGSARTTDPAAVIAAVGPGGSVGSKAGGPPTGLFVIVAVIGVLTLLGSWLLGGRRKRDANTMAAAQAGAGAGDGAPIQGAAAVAAAAAPRTRLGRTRLAAPEPAPVEPPGARPGKNPRSTESYQDPLVAAIVRSRDARSASGLSRPTTSRGGAAGTGGAGTAGPTGAAGSADPDFKGPTWVTRLDPHIKIMPALPVDPLRATEGLPSAPVRAASSTEGEARRSA